MQITTNKPTPSHDRLLFWGEEAADSMNLKMVVGRYDEPTDTVYVTSGPADDLTKKFIKLKELDVNLKISKHKNRNYFISDTFPSTSQIRESQSPAYSYQSFQNYQNFINESSPVISDEIKLRQKVSKPISKQVNELHDLRRHETNILIAEVLKSIKEAHEYHYDANI